jgi:hypothetical protein
MRHRSFAIGSWFVLVWCVYHFSSRCLVFLPSLELGICKRGLHTLARVRMRRLCIGQIYLAGSCIWSWPTFWMKYPSVFILHWFEMSVWNHNLNWARSSFASLTKYVDKLFWGLDETILLTSYTNSSSLRKTKAELCSHKAQSSILAQPYGRWNYREWLEADLHDLALLLTCELHVMPS